MRSNFDVETIWTSQKQMVEIFNVTPQNIAIHLKNIFNTRELDKKASCKESLQVQKEGAREVKRKIQDMDADHVARVVQPTLKTVRCCVKLIIKQREIDNNLLVF